MCMHDASMRREDDVNICFWIPNHLRKETSWNRKFYVKEHFVMTCANKSGMVTRISVSM